MLHKRHAQIGPTKSVFDELIDRHAEAYKEAFPEVKEFNGFERSGTGNYYIGMVWTNDNEKPDTNMLRIRGSYNLTENRIVELDTGAIDCQQSFFPGQIIAFLGDPFTKRYLTIRKILDPMRIAPPMKTINTDNEIRLIVASGPYMKPEQEDWSLYEKIIESVKEHNATHLVLMGPFVDVDNKIVRGRYDINWRACFDRLVEGLFNHPCCIYLVPSSRDVLPNYLSATYFYPSPPLDIDIRVKEGIAPKCRIIPVSDPAQIDLGGVYLDTTSAEVLFHLNRCSSFINKGGNTFNCMYRHLLSQGIYPIFPAPNEMAVDYPKLAKHIQLDRLGPHIVALSSRFNTSVNNVENRLIITAQKCSTKKQVVLVSIPKIESTPEAPINSVVITDFTHKIIDLLPSSDDSSQMSVDTAPKLESQQTSQPISVGSDS